MKKLYILKLGGSIVTNKKTSVLNVQRDLLAKIAKSISHIMKGNENISLIILHGAGGPGHHLAEQYGLQDGTGEDPFKLHGALLSRLTNQKLNTAVFDIFVENGAPIVPIHTGSTIFQDKKKITKFNTAIVTSTINNGFIPLIYGDMAFDKTLGLSICSGDASAAYLAKHLRAKKVLFATDTDGVFTTDPHIDKGASLINEISLQEVFSKENINLDKSHNTDSTGGLSGKLRAFKDFSKEDSSLEEIVIFNGNNPKNFKEILLNKSSIGTHIKIKKEVD